MRAKINFKKFLTPKEPLTRYLTQSNQFSAQNKRVKLGAFLPDTNLLLSVYRVYGLTDEEIWEIGKQNITQKSGRNIHGRADIKTSIVTQNGLSIDADNIPPRHANIKGWPSEKDERKLIAAELANKATLVISP